MKIKDLTKQAIIAAVYASLCIILAPISYGAIQFRVAEMLMVLPFFNKKHTIGLTLGCFLANLYSQLGLADMIFGTLATLLACIMVSRLKSMKFIALIVAVVNGLVIGAELFFIFKLPLAYSIATVGIGEFAAVLAGVLLVMVLEKNNVLRKLIEN